jgi:hypothetical protein
VYLFWFLHTSSVREKFSLVLMARPETLDLTSMLAIQT